MTHHRESRTKRLPADYWLDQHFDSSRRSQLAGERHILELISLGAPLPSILNKLCTAIDLQVGNVVSLVLLPDRDENHLCSVSQSATHVGLHLFSSTDIISRDMVFLGTLEIYCCYPRRPTWREYQLIELVVHLAAIALQRQSAEDDCEKPSRRSGSKIDSAPERPPFIN
jgi:hypothetical protein